MPLHNFSQYLFRGIGMADTYIRLISFTNTSVFSVRNSPSTSPTLLRAWLIYHIALGCRYELCHTAHPHFSQAHPSDQLAGISVLP